MIGKFIARHKLSVFLAFAGGILWFATGDVWFFVIGLGFVVLAATFTKLFRTILWLALAVYAGYAIPNGWIFAVALFALFMVFRLLRGITPIGDFGKGKPGK
ncbi:hypothetical protein [Gulosibacter sp. 10]|uniref:hypothetical protein n=1 Tax=Gulosibacter sp. 10 TaxID=1255570 RepID=UPI00097F410C|nr:hypothetical protein [Gulosibacter sp. 10]SJM69622.1 hypothetical protein FM112_14335 [Gulosibacter sp. 10]